MFIELTYLVELEDGYSIELLGNDILIGFSGISGITPYLDGKHFPTGHFVSFTELGKNRYNLFLRYDGEKIGISNGGVSRLLSIFFGNPFRHKSVVTVFLTNIKFSDKALEQFPGPIWGQEGVSNFFDRRKKPYISVPLPIELEKTQQEFLIHTLVSCDIPIFCDSPISNRSEEELSEDINLFASIASAHKKRIIYFLNANVRVKMLSKLINLIKKFRHQYLALGLRMCPFSVGFSICSYVRQCNIPIYGYNLFNVFHHIFTVQHY